MTQCSAIMQWLKTHESINDTEARDHLGIRRLASRINNLKERGEPIVSTLYAVKNRYGRTCRVARYSLAKGQMEMSL